MVPMKKITAVLIVLFVAFGFSACEKDDICDADTPTTPRLVIQFYNSTGVLKNVTNLKAVAEGMDTGVILNETGTEITRYLSNGNQIELPLDLTKDKVTYYLSLNATDTTLIKTDTIEFNYDRKTLYVSRACGYKTLFNLNNLPGIPRAFVLNGNNVPQIGNWINSVIVEKYNLESENETHIKIIF